MMMQEEAKMSSDATRIRQEGDHDVIDLLSCWGEGACNIELGSGADASSAEEEGWHCENNKNR